jgi:uncharacterized protein YgbK (DUF1537 family)
VHRPTGSGRPEEITIIMPAAIISKTDYLSGLPPEWPEDLLPEIQARVHASGRKIVVLDDDPTGTQTVHGVPVLTTWSIDALRRELQSDFPAFYILTNSRSLSAPAACSLGKEIGHNLRQACEETKAAVEVISRSDSTLRGHFPDEVDALKDGLGISQRPCLLVPFFLEGGRYTINDIHYVADGDQLIPAAQTPYARDAVFGYRHSHLVRWIEEKTDGHTPTDRITSITIEDLRRGGQDPVARKLIAMVPGDYGIVNAASYRDLEVLVAGLLQAEAEGQKFIFRTAASFVRVRAGIAPRDEINRHELTTANQHGGLFVVGSYVPKTTAQLTALMTKTDIAPVEITVSHLLDAARRDDEIDSAIRTLNRHLRKGEDAVLFTSRGLVKAARADDNLFIGQQVSDSLIRIVQGIDCQPRYLVAKGGITSSDVATQGIGVRRAMVMGQILPGVPVWKLGPETRYPDMAYIVFPGNVGDDDALVEIQGKLACQ